MRQSLLQFVARFRRLRPAAGARAQVALELRPGALMAVRVESGRMARTLHQACRPDQRRDLLERMRRGGWFDGASTYLVLGTAQRQLISTARPAVPDEELRDALRWQLRDALDYPPEEAVLDPLPVASTEPPGREEVLVFAVRRSELAPMVRTLTDVGIVPERVSVIDCAQRNLARHWVAQAGVTALLAPAAGGLLCTVSQGEQLILSRAMDVEADLTDGSAQMTQAAERIALQLQRTLDLLERRSADAAVTTLLVADWGPSAPLLRRVAELAGPRAQALPIEALLGPDEARASVRADAPHEFVHLLGACLMEAPAGAPAADLRPFDPVDRVAAPAQPTPIDREAPVEVAPPAAARPAVPTAAVAPVAAETRVTTADAVAIVPMVPPDAPPPVTEQGRDELPALELPASAPPARPLPRRQAGEARPEPNAVRARSGAPVPRRATTDAPGAAAVSVQAPASAGSFLLVDPAAALAAELARSVAASRPADAPAADATAEATPAAATAAPATDGRLELLP